MNESTGVLDVLPADDPFWSLLEQSLHGEPSPYELQELETRLAADATARRIYFDLCRVDADLYFVSRSARTDQHLADLIASDHETEATPLAASSIEVNEDLDEIELEQSTLWNEVVDVANRPLALAITIATLTIAIGLLSMAIWIVPAIRPPAPDPDVVALPEFVARLTLVEEAEWNAATQIDLDEGNDLYIGQTLELLQGAARLRFDHGVSVRIIAPARVRVVAEDRLQLEQGQLFATVGSDAQGFQIATPLCDVIDLGTEFAVDCEPQGNVDVYVHDGIVDVVPSQRTEPIQLRKGESLTITRDGNMSTTQEKKLAELRGISLASSTVRSLAKWQAYRDDLRADPTLIAYYDFQRDDTRPDRLINIATATAGTLDGQLGTADSEQHRPTWSEGRYLGQQALKFDGTTSQFVRITPEEPIDYPDGLTIAMWVRFDQEVLHPAVLVAQRERGQPFPFQMAAMHVAARPGARGMQFLSSYPMSGGYSDAPHRFGTYWQLLVVTSDDQETIFYRNGQEVARAACIQFQPSAVPISIGAGFERGAELPAHPLSGRIGELLIFGRSLDSEEIVQLFLQGRP